MDAATALPRISNEKYKQTEENFSRCSKKHDAYDSQSLLYGQVELPNLQIVEC